MLKYKIDEIETNFHEILDKYVIATDEYDAKDRIIQEIINNLDRYLDIYITQVEDLSDNIDAIMDERRLEEIDKRNKEIRKDN